MQHTSLKVFDTADVDSCATTVKMLLSSNVNAGKVIVVVEGIDDKAVYENCFSSSAVLVYPDGNCDKHAKILEALRPYKKRLLAIKDADFDRLRGISAAYDNMFLTDTHDLEGMILRCDVFRKLSSEDRARCSGVDVGRLKKELEDISYLKWHNIEAGLKLNFRDVSVCHPADIYLDRVLKNSDTEVSYSAESLKRFKESHRDADLDELTNGHDLFEKIYIEAQKANKANFPQKSFFKRIRKAYGFEEFRTTNLYAALKSRESSFGQPLFGTCS